MEGTVIIKRVADQCDDVVCKTREHRKAGFNVCVEFVQTVRRGFSVATLSANDNGVTSKIGKDFRVILISHSTIRNNSSSRRGSEAHEIVWQQFSVGRVAF